jgi:hypothetical protein
MKSIGFIPRLDEDQFRPRKKLTELVVVHEDGSPRQVEFIETLGKPLEAIAKEVKMWEAKGLYKDSQDAFKIKMIEQRLKPQAFITRVKGDKEIEELMLYINGEQRDTGQGIVNVAPSHPRTWCVGNCDPLRGIEINNDFDVVKKEFEGSGKFSKLSECTWPEMKAMR